MSCYQTEIIKELIFRKQNKPTYGYQAIKKGTNINIKNEKMEKKIADKRKKFKCKGQVYSTLHTYINLKVCENVN